MSTPHTETFIVALAEAGVRVEYMRDALPRSAARTWSQRDVQAIKGVCFHHSATAGGDLAALIGVANYHVGPNHISDKGCPGVCYTAAILADGTLVICNDLESKTWSQGTAKIPGDENAAYLGIVALGSFRSPGNPSGGEPTPQQMLTVLQVIDVCYTYFGWEDGIRVFGHFDFGKAACPGSTLEAIIRAARANVVTHTGHDLDTAGGRQAALNELGYPLGAVDGVWGARSRAALCQFQKEHGLSVDAVWGPRVTAAVLDALKEAKS